MNIFLRCWHRFHCRISGQKTTRASSVGESIQGEIQSPVFLLYQEMTSSVGMVDSGRMSAGGAFIPVPVPGYHASGIRESPRANDHPTPVPVYPHRINPLYRCRIVFRSKESSSSRNRFFLAWAARNAATNAASSCVRPVFFKRPYIFSR